MLVTTDFNDLVGRDYEVVYADPPWEYYGDPNKPQAAGKHYSMMSYQQLAELPVRSIMAKVSVAFVWATSSKLFEATHLITGAWDLYFRGVFQVWVKTTNDGRIIHGQGVRPSFTKPTCEYLLVASTKAKGRPFPLFTEAMENVVLAARPGNEHSRKPGIFRDNIVRLLGQRKQVELFARETIPGWDAWGNEVT